MRRMSFKLLIPAGLLSALLMLNPSAMAVGLGSVEVDTRLNEPLRAEIPLRSVGSLDIDQLEVSLASAEEFARVGIDRPAVLTQLSFEVAGGDRGPVIRVTSEQPITEPFLSFLVRASWPQGRLLREYTVLLDPPVTAPAAAPQREQAPSRAVRRDEPTDAAAPEPSEPTAGRPSEPDAGEQEPAARPSGGTYGPVASGETLWSIANQARPDSSISVNQMMLALLRTNPDAFFRDNINALRRGAVLRVPNREEIQRLAASEALDAVRRQNDLWQDYRRNLAEEAPTVVAGGEAQDRAAADEPAADEGSRLELVPPREGGAEAGAAAAGPGEESAQAEAEELREELSRTREELLARTAESDQQSARVDELETQVERLQRLLELKNEELAAIQAQSGEPEDGEAPAGQAEPTEPEWGAEEPAADEPGVDEGAVADDADLAEDTGDAAPGAVSETREPAEEEAAEPEAAAPPPAPRGGGWLELLLSPVVLGIAGLLLIGIGVALFLHRRGGGQAQSTVQREAWGDRMTRREKADEAPDDRGEPTVATAAPEPDETDFGPPESGPADYDEAALRAALEESPEDTQTRLKLIRHYAAAGDREAFIAQAETLYADLADPASPAWLETRELGEEIAPDHALFGGGHEDIRSTAGREDEPVSAPDTGAYDEAPPEREAPAEEESGERDAGGDLPDLDFETPAPEEPPPSEPTREEPAPRSEPEPESPTASESAGDDQGFDLSGLDLGEREEPSGDRLEDASEPREPEEKVSDDTFDLGDTAESRDSEEQEPLEFDLSDFETESESDSEAEDWMSDSAGESEAPETRDAGPESGGGETTPDVGPDMGDESGGEAATGAGDDAVDTKLELAEAYMDMSDEEGAREMLEEVLGEGNEEQKKRAREILDKLT